MTTLNARANQAWHELVDRWGRERGTDSPWIGFDNQRDAFEEGWETGYKTRVAEELRKAADAIESVWEGVEESGQPYTPALAAGQLRARAADLDAAVPQPVSEATPELTSRPVDREALYWAISEASERQGVAKFLEEEDIDAFATAALAVLAGGQEQA